MTEQIALPLTEVRSSSRFPREPIMRAAEIEGPYRWTATRVWGPGPCILWTLLNPSKADGDRDDPTMQRMMGFSYRWGFGSLIVTNVYPFIASKPEEMQAWRRTWNAEAAQSAGFDFALDHSSFNAWIKNHDVVKSALDKASAHVAAWGNGVDADDLASFLESVQLSVDTSEHDGFGIVDVPVEWKCLGWTASGAPIHPLARGSNRVPDDAQLVAWKKS